MPSIYLTIGPPGCGKTTYLCDKAAEAAERFGSDRVLICSLTKAAAAEVAGRGIDLPKSAVGTMHSHCFRLLGCPKLAESKLAEWNADNPTFRMTGDLGDAENRSESFRVQSPGDYHYQRVCLWRASNRDEGFPAGSEVYWDRWQAWKDRKGYPDFEDLIVRAREEYASPPGHPSVVYLDEAQDSSASEIALIEHWAHTASVVIVGDLDQSIFQFRGACPRAFLELNIPAERRRVLEQSWRVPEAVHAAAVKWIEQIRDREPVAYRPRPDAGEVRKVPWGYLHAERLLREAQPYLDDGKSVMFLGSCHWHLQPLIAVMRREGIPFHNPYRLTNGQWNPLAARNGVTAAQRMRAFLEPQTQRTWSLGGLHKWIEVIESKGNLTAGAKTQVKAWLKEDRPPELDDEMLAGLFQGDTVSQAVTAAWDSRWDWLVNRVTKSKRKSFDFPVQVATRRGIDALGQTPQICVGTIHSTKGGESDVVFVFPELSQAGLQEWCGSGRDSLIRLFYVAMTRARESLILCSPATPMHVQWN